MVRPGGGGKEQPGRALHRWAVRSALPVLFVAWAGVAHAEPVRILVAAGHKLGLAAESPLKYADADATRVGEVLVTLGGVRSENAIILAEPSRAQLFAAIDRARAVAEKHAPEEVTLVFYFSGHGDRAALHLGEERVLVTELTAKLGEVPAGLRIAITDACRTNREKGFVADEAFAISATTTPQATGQVWLHASREGEAAQESDELRGAIFTHAWLNGLRGAADANGDARVTLDESFAFAHSQTLIRSAKSSGVMQKPEAVVSLRELAPVVLTQTGSLMGTLSLPVARDTHFLVYTVGGTSVVSELWGSPERRIALAVPPGRYVVQRRFANTGGAAQIALAAGEERKLDDRDFASSTLEALAKKGEMGEAEPVAVPIKSTRHELSAGYQAGTDARTGFVHGPRAEYAFVSRRLALIVGAGADLAGRTLPDTSERLVSGFGRAALEVRIPFGMAVTSAALHLGAGARAGWLSQTLERTAGTTTNGAFVFGPEALVALRIALGPRFFADVDARGTVVVLKEEGKMRGIPGAALGTSLGAQF